MWIYPLPVLFPHLPISRELETTEICDIFASGGSLLRGIRDSFEDHFGHKNDQISSVAIIVPIRHIFDFQFDLTTLRDH